ncbi:MAG: N-acetylmuramoyl-L-alanine amidase, partial [Candidatus Geothermincolales bacterium]
MGSGSPGGSFFGVKVCLDPGHGGSDPGAIGPTGLLEKDVNLKVALKLKSLLEAEGASVLLTRADDRYVSLSERCQIANSWRADIFVSIHHNSVGDPSVNGTETLISPAAGEFTRQLANSVQAELVAELKLANRGVKERSLVVLNNTVMPAILTEASFISNPDEERRLRDDAYLEREARAILRGMKVPAKISFISPREGALAGRQLRVYLQVVGEDAVESVKVNLEGVGERVKTAPPFEFFFELDKGQDGERKVSATVKYRDGNTFSAARSVICAPSATRWYFAEGCTRENFDEWLTLFNPGVEETVVSVTYAFAEGSSMSRKYAVQGMTRRTVNVVEEVGRG